MMIIKRYYYSILCVFISLIVILITLLNHEKFEMYENITLIIVSIFTILFSVFIDLKSNKVDVK